MGFTQEASADRAIVGVCFFAEPPSWLTELAFETAGLPTEFIGNADADLDLGGRLVNHLVALGGTPRIEHIARLVDSASQSAYYVREARSSDWEVYHASYPSGVRYSCLVEFLRSDAHPGDPDRAPGDSSTTDPPAFSDDRGKEAAAAPVSPKRGGWWRFWR